MAAYHCQQATEKSMKGLLAAVGIAFRKTHDLDELADLVPTPDPAVRQLLDTVRPLNACHRPQTDHRRVSRVRSLCATRSSRTLSHRPAPRRPTGGVSRRAPVILKVCYRPNRDVFRVLVPSLALTRCEGTPSDAVRATFYSVLGTRRACRAVARARMRSRMIAKSPGGNMP